MILKVAYDDKSINFIDELELLLTNYPLIELQKYHEQVFKERKKALSLKYEWGTKKTPFAILIDDNNNPIIAFYGERKECTSDKINEALHNWIAYGNKN